MKKYFSRWIFGFQNSDFGERTRRFPSWLPFCQRNGSSIFVLFLFFWVSRAWSELSVSFHLDPRFLFFLTFSLLCLLMVLLHFPPSAFFVFFFDKWRWVSFYRDSSTVTAARWRMTLSATPAPPLSNGAWRLDSVSYRSFYSFVSPRFFLFFFFLTAISLLPFRFCVFLRSLAYVRNFDELVFR